MPGGVLASHTRNSLNPTTTRVLSPLYRGEPEAQRGSVACLRSHSPKVVKLQSHFGLAPKGPRVVARVSRSHTGLWLLSWRPAEEAGLGGRSQPSESPENKPMIAWARQALLRAVAHQTSSAFEGMNEKGPLWSSCTKTADTGLPSRSEGTGVKASGAPSQQL